MSMNQFCQLLVDNCFEDLPKATIEKTKKNILNLIGGALGASDSFLPLSLLELQSFQGGKPMCNVLGHGIKMPAIWAAAINSSMAEVFLEEDMHMDSQAHPGTVVIPTVLAIGQQNNAGGKEIIDATVAGYEAIGRIGRCLINKDFAQNGMRPSSFLAPIGSAVAAGKLLKLDAEQMMNAISIAGNTSSGLMEYANGGTADFCYQNALAVQAGIMAASLSQKGLKSTPAVIEGKFGMGNAYSKGNYDVELLTRDFGKPFEIENTFIKVYSGCAFVQVTAQGAVHLREMNDIDLEQIRQVKIGTYARGYYWPGVVNPGPFHGIVQSMMSHQFMAAAALIYGNVSSHTVKHFNDPQITELSRKAEVFIDSNCDENFPLLTGGTVEVLMEDGRRFFSYEKDLKGADLEFVKLRMRRNSQEILEESIVETIIKEIDGLEYVMSISEIMGLAAKK